MDESNNNYQIICSFMYPRNRWSCNVIKLLHNTRRAVLPQTEDNVEWETIFFHVENCYMNKISPLFICMKRTHF